MSAGRTKVMRLRLIAWVVFACVLVSGCQSTRSGTSEPLVIDEEVTRFENAGAPTLLVFQSTSGASPSRNAKDKRRGKLIYVRPDVRVPTKVDLADIGMPELSGQLTLERGLLFARVIRLSGDFMGSQTTSTVRQGDNVKEPARVAMSSPNGDQSLIFYFVCLN